MELSQACMMMRRAATPIAQKSSRTKPIESMDNQFQQGDTMGNCIPESYNNCNNCSTGTFAGRTISQKERFERGITHNEENTEFKIKDPRFEDPREALTDSRGQATDYATSLEKKHEKHQLLQKIEQNLAMMYNRDEQKKDKEIFYNNKPGGSTKIDWGARKEINGTVEVPTCNIDEADQKEIRNTTGQHGNANSVLMPAQEKVEERPAAATHVPRHLKVKIDEYHDSIGAAPHSTRNVGHMKLTNTTSEYSKHKFVHKDAKVEILEIIMKFSLYFVQIFCRVCAYFVES
jgi:hypothetical protein